MGLSDLIYSLAKHMLQRCQSVLFNTFANGVKMRYRETVLGIIAFQGTMKNQKYLPTPLLFLIYCDMNWHAELHAHKICSQIVCGNTTFAELSNT